MTRKKTPMKETPADAAVTQKALENSGARLLEHVTGVEEVLERIEELKEQLRTKFAVAKSDGYDPKAIKAAVRERAKTDEQRAAAAELDLVVQTYLDALEAVELVE